MATDDSEESKASVGASAEDTIHGKTKVRVHLGGRRLQIVVVRYVAYVQIGSSKAEVPQKFDREE